MSVVVSREPGIDAFRYLLMMPVILAHSWAFAGPLELSVVNYLPLIIGHSAVPFFFIASGYQLRWSESDPFAVTRWSCRKLLPLYLIWVLIYVLAAWIVGQGPLSSVIWSVFRGGPTRHLWFLPALAFALSFTSVSLRLLGPRLTWILTVVVAALGIWHGSYQVIVELPAHPVRSGLLAGPLFALIGVQFAKSGPPRAPVAFGLAVLVCYAAQIVEDVFISGFVAGGLQSGPMITLATIPFSAAVFLFARSLTKFQFLEMVAKLRRYVLIIYCVHPMVIFAIDPIVRHRTLSMALFLMLIVLGLSTLIAMACGAVRDLWRGKDVSSSTFPAMSGRTYR